jgi:hypothetical protein
MVSIRFVLIEHLLLLFIVVIIMNYYDYCPSLQEEKQIDNAQNAPPPPPPITRHAHTSLIQNQKSIENLLRFAFDNNDLSLSNSPKESNGIFPKSFDKQLRQIQRLYLDKTSTKYTKHVEPKFLAEIHHFQVIEKWLVRVSAKSEKKNV